jgi:hypothetical protein
MFSHGLEIDTIFFLSKYKKSAKLKDKNTTEKRQKQNTKEKKKQKKKKSWCKETNKVGREAQGGLRSLRGTITTGGRE